ncbi:hypothetical protein BJV78DRAFT_1151128 [Lactifluus subvellereus]|nr:hypothetical protein BJV78DRAFT_1151128 [Lactifluus subvellereus]
MTNFHDHNVLQADATLLAVVVIFVGFNSTTPIDCKIFAYLAFVFASALIVLRIVAIWERNLVISAIAVAAWLMNIAFYIRSVVRAESVWSSESNSCLVLYSERSFTNVIVTLVEDSVLLVLMLSGLRRYRESGKVGIWGLLYRQGLLWIVLVTVAEIPSAGTSLLRFACGANISFPMQTDYFNLMFQTPELIMMAVGASRIYRGLADYSSMTEFNWEDEKSWAMRGGPASSLTAPATIRFQTVQSTQNLPEDSETSRTEADTAKVSRAKMAGKLARFTSTGTDSAV